MAFRTIVKNDKEWDTELVEVSASTLPSSASGNDIEIREVSEALEETVTKQNMSKGYMYILECADGSYYTGSTKDLEKRLWEHQNMLGANYTKRRLPVKLVYYEEYQRIDEAFYREKQVQGWNRKKKEALINGTPELLPKLAIAYRDLRNESSVASRTSATNDKKSSDTVAYEKSVDTELVEVSDSTLASRTSTTDVEKTYKNNKNLEQ